MSPGGVTRAQPSQEAGSKTQWSWGSRERLTSSPRSAKSYEGVLESHDGLSPSQGSEEEDSAEPGSQERLMPSPRTKENQGGVLASLSDSARLWREEGDSSKLRKPKETQPSLKEPRTNTEG